MADYRYATADVSGPLIRMADNAFIPVDFDNADYLAFRQWFADGGVPDPFPSPVDVTPLVVLTAAQILGASP